MDVSYNLLGDRVCDSLSRLVVTGGFRSLVELNLAHNLIGDDGCSTILLALEQQEPDERVRPPPVCPRLLKLDLRSNFASETCLVAYSRPLPQCPAMEELLFEPQEPPGGAPAATGSRDDELDELAVVSRRMRALTQLFLLSLPHTVYVHTHSHLHTHSLPSHTQLNLLHDTTKFRLAQHPLPHITAITYHTLSPALTRALAWAESEANTAAYRRVRCWQAWRK